MFMGDSDFFCLPSFVYDVIIVVGSKNQSSSSPHVTQKWEPSEKGYFFPFGSYIFFGVAEGIIVPDSFSGSALSLLIGCKLGS